MVRGATWYYNAFSKKICWNVAPNKASAGNKIELFSWPQDKAITGGLTVWNDVHHVLGVGPDANGCVEAWLEGYDKFAPGFKIKLSDAAGTVIADFPIQIAYALIFFDYPYYSAMLAPDNTVNLDVVWQVDPAAMAYQGDTIVVKNLNGHIVSWFFTNCNCQHDTTAAAVAHGWHSVSFKLEPNHPPGGYRAYYKPNDGQMTAAIDDQWLSWEAEGL
jgi:hypothetical protein